jgi:hypothetical protein
MTAVQDHRAGSGFHRHLVEMTLSMVLPFAVFFAVVRVVFPSAEVSPPFSLIPVGILVMVVPMTALMLFRRHGLRDILEMNASMFAGMLIVIPAARLALPTIGIPFGLEQTFVVAVVAMTTPMIALMYARRRRYAHHAHV